MSFVKLQNCVLENTENDANSVQISGNILPSTTNTFSLGSPNKVWNSLNLESLKIGPCSITSANAGTLVTSFGNEGKIIADFSFNTDSIATSVVIDQQNNVIVGGFDFVNNSTYAFAKYFENGQLDTTFGKNGYVVTDLSNDYNIFGTQGFDLYLYSSFKINAIDNNNNIILSGYIGNYVNYDIFVARFLPNGQIDTTFGTNGIVISDFSGNDSSQEYSVVVDKRNNIIVVGRSYNESDDINYYALARYLPTGVLDASFGNQGTIVNTFSNTDSSVALSVAFDKNDNIVISGIDHNSDTGNSYYALARYLPDGSLDTSFGNEGIVINQYFSNSGSLALSLAIDQNNNIVIAGFASGQYALARYLPTGSLDYSFGYEGTIVSSFTENSYYSQVNAVVVDVEGNIIIGGFDVNPYNPSVYSYVLVKYLPDGQTDISFGDNGMVLTSFNSNNSSSLQIANSIAIDRNNNLIVAGIDWNISDINYAVVKYRNFPDLVGQINGSVAYSITGR